MSDGENADTRELDYCGSRNRAWCIAAPAPCGVHALVAERDRAVKGHGEIAALTGTWQQIAEAAQRIARRNAGIVSSADAALTGGGTHEG